MNGTMFSLPSVHSLVSSINYGVMRDPVLHESIVVSGRTIQEHAETSRDFRHYALEAPIPQGYVRLLCNGFSLAIWRDPTRPELNLFEKAEFEIVPLRQGTTAEIAAEDKAADLALAAELAEPDPESLEYFLVIAGRRFAASLYAK